METGVANRHRMIMKGPVFTRCAAVSDLNDPSRVTDSICSPEALRVLQPRASGSNHEVLFGQRGRIG
jgi:hypothetical protein